MQPNMKPKTWLLVALFLGAALLTAWFSPGLGHETQAAANQPESALPGGLNGQTILRSGETLAVKVASTSGARDIEWRLDGRVVGHRPNLQMAHLRDGEHKLSLVYRDAQGQLYAAHELVRVLAPEPYTQMVDAVQAAITLPLWDEDTPVYLPIIKR